MFLAVAVGTVAATAASVRCIDAARELARLTARGEPDRGRAVAAEIAPAGAAITVSVEGDEIVAEVAASPVGPLPVRVGGQAVAVLEPGVATSSPGRGAP